MTNDKTAIPIAKVTIRAAEDLPAHRFVNYEGGLCGVDEAILGVTDRAWAAGELAAVCFSGIMPVEAGADMYVKGSQVASGTGGIAIMSEGTFTGVCLFDNGGSGECVRVKI